MVMESICWKFNNCSNCFLINYKKEREMIKMENLLTFIAEQLPQEPGQD